MGAPDKKADTDAAPASHQLRAKWAEWQRSLDRYATWLAPRLPFAIAAFFAIQVVIRVLLSGNLEVDEAQFVGATGFALGFGNSHPPLYHWLVTAVLWVSGGAWVVSMSVVKNALLAGHFILAWDLLRRLKAAPMVGLMAAAALAFLPQIIWQGQVTLAHSVAVGFATLATLHAAAIWLRRPRLSTALWLGVAIAIGVLSKYNYLLFIAAFAAAAWTLPAIRMRLDWRTGWLVAAVATILILPHLVWALAHFDLTTARVEKLYSERNQIIGFDVPLLGIDGLASLALALLAWGAPLALVWGWLAWKTKPAEPPQVTDAWDFTDDYAKLCGRAAWIAAAALALIVLLGDMHKVHERYLTPLLLPAVVWLALSYPLDRRPMARGVLTGLATALFLASVVAIPATVAFGPSRLAYPYAAIADEIAGTEVVPSDVLAHRQHLAANVALRLPVGAVWSGESDRRVIVLWPRGERPPAFLIDRLGDDYAPAGDIAVHTHAYSNWSGRSVTVRSQVFERVR